MNDVWQDLGYINIFGAGSKRGKGKRTGLGLSLLHENIFDFFQPFRPPNKRMGRKRGGCGQSQRREAGGTQKCFHPAGRPIGRSLGGRWAEPVEHPLSGRL